MSFLMPFYIAGLAALSLPILFHLIRRAPKGQLPFSSLMFLRPSPPRLTRRSRLDHILLLALRALALCLLALAFARPFLREMAELDIASSRGRRVALLVDVSASMRRGDAWTQARQSVAEALEGLGPTDQVALYTFDTRVRELVGFDEETGGAARAGALVRGGLEQVAPGWGATDLGTALVTVADALEGFNDTRELDAALEIVLVSDLQSGSRLDGLQAYEWPADVRLTVEGVALPDTTNAGVVLLPRDAEAIGDQRQRARVVNDEESVAERFELRWETAGGEPAGAALGVYVPPGQSRVIPVPLPAEDSRADRLVLSGDDHTFDNTFHYARGRRENVTVAYIGEDAADDPRGMRYYLAHALDASGRYEITIAQSAPEEALRESLEGKARLVVVAAAADESLQRRLQSYMSTGGTVLYVLKDAASAQAVEGILNATGLNAGEATTADYAMLSEIDFGHPLFTSFADPRFGDFTKIRFWKHRRMKVPDGAAGKVLARFDDGDPALFEHRYGEGRLLVLTSGWHPSDSQLALSTKFVPLLVGMLEEGGQAALDRRLYEVGQAIPLSGSWGGQMDAPVDGPTDGAAESARGETRRQDAAPASRRDRRIVRPDGRELELEAGAAALPDTDVPGIYRLIEGESEQSFAVNVAASESQTAPLAVERLEQFGIRLGARAEDSERRQQLRDLELEGRQKLWRWLIAGALGVLILETWFAGRLARPRREHEEAATE